MTWKSRIQDPRRQRVMRVRTQVESAIREFFLERGFLETRTPILVPCPGMETHIRPFEVIRAATNPDAPAPPEGRLFLPTSPEFAMKRLLVGGLEKIFQIIPAFRDEPLSTTHRPEFTMLEWYRAHAGYESIMKDTEELFAHVAKAIHGAPVIRTGGREISVATPWPRYKIRDLFAEHVQVDLANCSISSAIAAECRRLGLDARDDEPWDDLYFKIWLNFIEPRLPQDRAVIVMRYPPSQAALSIVDSDPDGSRWARRFEAYAGGLELGNAFEELTDPIEQRQRFEKDMDQREQIYGAGFPRTPIDEGFLEALAEGMPPSGGIAVGVDRMVMLFADETDIDYAFWI